MWGLLMSFADGMKQTGIKDILNNIMPMKKKIFQIQGYIGYPLNFQSIHLESIRGPPTMPWTMETEVSRATRNM